MTYKGNKLCYGSSKIDMGMFRITYFLETFFFSLSPSCSFLILVLLTESFPEKYGDRREGLSDTFYITLGFSKTFIVTTKRNNRSLRKNSLELLKT